jgi:hypothetical protein
VFQLAQVNIGHPRAPVDAPLQAEFIAALEPVNARADAAAGSWTSLEVLRDFVYGDPEHLSYMRRRREWFHTPEAFTFREHFLPLDWAPSGRGAAW